MMDSFVISSMVSHYPAKVSVRSRSWAIAREASIWKSTTCTQRTRLPSIAVHSTASIIRLRLESASAQVDLPKPSSVRDSFAGYCCVVRGLHLGPTNAPAACRLLQVNLSIGLGICSSGDESDGCRPVKWTHVLSGVGPFSPTTFRSSGVGWSESSMTIDLLVTLVVVLLIGRSFLSSSCTLGARGARTASATTFYPSTLSS